MVVHVSLYRISEILSIITDSEYNFGMWRKLFCWYMGLSAFVRSKKTKLDLRMLVVNQLSDKCSSRKIPCEQELGDRPQISIRWMILINIAFFSYILTELVEGAREWSCGVRKCFTDLLNIFWSKLYVADRERDILISRWSPVSHENSHCQIVYLTEVFISARFCWLQYRAGRQVMGERNLSSAHF